jgi:Zinc finger, C3HC4 type (RING finger)
VKISLSSIEVSPRDAGSGASSDGIALGSSSAKKRRHSHVDLTNEKAFISLPDEDELELLSVRCSKCLETNPGKAKFCMNCGSSFVQTTSRNIKGKKGTNGGQKSSSGVPSHPNQKSPNSASLEKRTDTIANRLVSAADDDEIQCLRRASVLLAQIEEKYTSKQELTTDDKTSMRAQLSEAYKSMVTCQICSDSIKDMVVTICGHIYCRKCIGTWCKQKPVCPQCKSDLSLHGIHQKLAKAKEKFGFHPVFL